MYTGVYNHAMLPFIASKTVTQNQSYSSCKNRKGFSLEGII